MSRIINVLLLAIGGVLTLRLAGGRAALRRPTAWIGLGLIAGGVAAAWWGGSHVDLVHAGQLSDRWYGIGMATALVGSTVGVIGGMGLLFWRGRHALTGRSFALAHFRRRLDGLAAGSLTDPAVEAGLRELHGNLGAGTDDLMERRHLMAEVDRLLARAPDRARAALPQ